MPSHVHLLHLLTPPKVLRILRCASRIMLGRFILMFTDARRDPALLHADLAQMTTRVEALEAEVAKAKAPPSSPPSLHAPPPALSPVAGHRALRAQRSLESTQRVPISQPCTTS